MAPHRKDVLCAEVVRALVTGTLACFATACVAGAIYDVDAEGGAAHVGANGTNGTNGTIAIGTSSC